MMYTTIKTTGDVLIMHHDKKVHTATKKSILENLKKMNLDFYRSR